MWKVSEPRHLIGDLHPIHWQLGEEPMLLHLPRDHIGVELGDKTRWTVVLYYLDHALGDLLVLKDFFLEGGCV